MAQEDAPAEKSASTWFENSIRSASGWAISLARRLTGWIPIIGKLWLCRPNHLREAFYEFCAVMIFSTLPLWFFPLISLMIFTTGFGVGEVVDNGELLIYAATFSGTMVYFISKRYGSVDRTRDVVDPRPFTFSVSFPYGGLFVISSALICMFSAASFFALKVFQKMPDTVPIKVSSDGAASLSWILFVVSAALFFCAVAYRNLLDDGESYKSPSEEDIMARWKADRER